MKTFTMPTPSSDLPDVRFQFRFPNGATYPVRYVWNDRAGMWTIEIEGVLDRSFLATGVDLLSKQSVLPRRYKLFVTSTNPLADVSFVGFDNGDAHLLIFDTEAT